MARRLLWPIKDKEPRESLGIGRTKTYELIARGELVLVKIDGKSLITDESREALARLIEASRRER